MYIYWCSVSRVLNKLVVLKTGVEDMTVGERNCWFNPGFGGPGSHLKPFDGISSLSSTFHFPFICKTNFVTQIKNLDTVVN